MEIDVSLRKCYYNNNLCDLKYLENEVRTMSSLDKQIDFTENSCKDFIDVLASSAPIPGGGGASALVGAIGVALGNMVGSLTVGKKRYADVEEDIIRCKKEADEITKRLLELVAKDAEVFEPLSKAYSLPKSTPEELAKELNMPVDKVREISKISQEPVSLETPIGEEEDSHLGDFIPDEDAPAPSEAASFVLLKEQLGAVLETLSEREAKVLRLRFGLDDGRARTLEEVGKEFDVTRERIRQIEAKALRKLRHPSRSKKLKDFLD